MQMGTCERRRKDRNPKIESYGYFSDADGDR